MVKHIVLESQINDLAIIKINRPEVLNALDKEVEEEILSLDKNCEYCQIYLIKEQKWVTL
jgi:enoyl-CoA hydratase/carnithine racemase